MMPIAVRRPGSDRPATGLYLFGGRGQPVGITALLVTHTISTLPSACRPRPCWQSPGTPGLSCSGLVTTPAEVVEEGSGLGGDAGLGGYLLGADGDSG